MELDLKQVVRIARRWWWLLLLAPLIGGFTANYVGSQRTPLYSASATLFISPGSLSPDNYSSIYNSQNIASTYAMLIYSQPVLSAAAKDLGLPGVSVSASVVPNSLFLRVSSVDSNPQRAAAVANAVANEFVVYIQQQSAGQTAQVRTNIDSQIKQTQQKISDYDKQIAALQANNGPTTPAGKAQLQSLQSTRDGLAQDLTQLQYTARQIDVQVATSQTRLTVSSPAYAPSVPFAPETSRSTRLGAFAGLMIALGAVVLLEYLDNTVRSSDELTRLTGSPALATVQTAPKVQPGGRQVYVLSDPKSPASEAIRLLRANLEFAAAAKPITTLAITSAGPTEGKSTVTANLGVVMAQAGFETVIIDTDLRKPTQDRIFGVGNEQGLTTLLSHPKQDWQSLAVRVAVPRLSLIPSGPLPPNPADLLSLDRFDDLLAQISEAADVVLLDTSPVLAVSDPLVVGTKSSGVLLVCRAGQTRRDALRRAAATFRQGEIRLVGTVLNQQRARDEAGYYYYGYYGVDANKTAAAMNGSAAPHASSGTGESRTPVAPNM